MKKIYLKLMALALLSVLSVTNAWADPWVKLDVSTGSQGTKTVGDQLYDGSEWWFNYQTNGGWSSGTDIQVLIGTSSSSYSTVNASWYADDGSNKKVHANIGSFEFDKSGIWYAVGKYYAGSKTAYTSGTSFTNNGDLSTSMSTSNSPYWTVNPPSVKSFAVSTEGSDILSGTGTSGDPYIISFGGSLVLTLSGSQNKTDANSSLQYNTSGTWNTTTSRTISSIKSTTKTSVTVKMRCYNSTASLSGTESSETIYYKSETPYTITVQTDGSGFGTVSPSTVYTKGDVASESFTASVPVADAAKYEFVDWSATSGVTLQSSASSATNTVKSTGNGTVTANFQRKQYSIAYSPVSASHCTYTTTPANARYGTTVNLQIDPDANYVVSSVTAVDASSNTVTVSGSEPNYSFTMPASNVTVTVVTALNKVTVTYGAGSNGSLAATVDDDGIDSGDEVDGGSQVDFTATPSSGYEVEGWYETYDEGEFDDKIDAAGNDNTYTIDEVTSNVSVYVKFIALNTVTISNGTVYGGSATSVSAGLATTAKIQPNAAAAGKKFKQWELGSGVSLADGYAVTDRVIEINASANGTVTATYEDRDKVKIYFKAPGGDWNPPYAYIWYSEDDTKKNAAYPGEEMSIVTVNCVEYYYYEYYTDDNDEDDDATDNAYWNKVIFNKGTGSNTEYPTPSWNKTRALNVSDGHFYFYHCAAGSTGSAYGSDWYIRGNFNNTADWSSWDKPITINCATNSGSIDMEDLSSSYTQYFRIYQISTEKEYRITSSSSNAEVTMSTEYTLYNQISGADYFRPAETTDYRFTLNVETPSAPVLTVRPANDENYTVTFAVSGHGSISTPGTGSQTIHRYATTTITAVEDAGYRFTGWTVTGTNASNVSIANTSSKSTTVTAHTSTEGVTITANFTNEGIVYLDKSAISSSWGGTPYVYFYSTAYWDGSSKGSGSKSSKDVTVYGPYEMRRIGDSQIWYYDYSSTPGTGTTKNYIAFNDHRQEGYDNFVACLAIYRGDFYQKQNMFVVKDYKYYYNTGAAAGQAVYYNDGYWRKYNDTDPGYVIKTYNAFGSATCTGTYRLSSDEPGANNCTVDIPLNSGANYFKVVGCDTTTINYVDYAGTYYRDGSNGTMNTDNCTNWLLTDASGSNTGVLATASADYKFTLTLGAGNLYISVDFPLAVGDFRLMYDGKMRTTYNSKKQHPSNFIRKLKQPTIADDTTRVDTISFFVDPATGDLVPSLKFQYCNNIDGYTISWRDTLSAIDLTDIEEVGIYNFIVTQTNDKSGDHRISCVLDKAYTGDYYIRTNSAKGGWKSYKVSADNLLTFSDYAKKHSGYDYYFCKWVDTDANVKFTIANDYSECITDTVDNDDIVNRDNPNNGKLQYQASVRFMYNSATNVITRAYLNGSSDGIANYLYIKAKDGTGAGNNDSIKNADGSAITSVDGYKEVKFEDNNNWVYVKNIQAREGTHVRLISDYYDNSSHHYQYLKGSNAGTWTAASTSQIIGGTSGAYQTLRMVYDFKTNQLLAAWMPSGSEIDEELPIYADVMIIREAQGDAKQITFGEFGSPSKYGSLTDIETVYGVMQFNKYTLNNQSKEEGHAALTGEDSLSAYARDLYWISFPFDVNLNDVFGFGTYGTHWIIEYYDGKGRAQNGFWVDSKPNWKFVTPDMRDTFKLKAFEGYILALDLDEMNLGTNTGVWANNVTDVYLYFPSSTTLGSIVRKDTTITIDQNGYQCTINRQQPGDEYDVNKNRTIADSYWHCIGIPSFANNVHAINNSEWTTNQGDNTSAVDYGDYPSISNWSSNTLPYLYEWNASNNRLIPISTANYTFKATHSYMVQYNLNTITWSAVSTPVKAIAARQMDTPDRNYCLQLLKDSVHQDQTFISLTDKAGVTSGFEFNYDLSKEYNSGIGNIWTLTTNGVQVAGNSMPHPLATTIVPVGVKIATAGEYTFTMPEGTNGGDVWLLDNQTNSRTNLGLMDYTVNLTAGTIDGRFSLEFPVQNVVTELENDGMSRSDELNDANDAVRKVFVGGRLYIIRDGKAYDATGAQVR